MNQVSHEALPPADIDWDSELADNAIWKPEEDIDDGIGESMVVDQEALHKLGRLALTPSKFTEFAFYMPTGPNGEYKNFSFEGREHMRRCYDTPARRVLLFCARQIEKSTLLGNRALCYMCLVPSFRILYVSPSSTQTVTFSNDRVREPIETSPVLKRFTTQMLSQNILGKQLINRSMITMRYAFLNADRARGIPAYALMVDEFQDVLADNIPVLEQCLSHAPERWKNQIYAGTPKSLDNNLEIYRERYSTQGEWVVPCDRCGDAGSFRYWNILGEKNIQEKGLSCERCGKSINPRHPDAQWAFMVKDAPFESYRIPQLMVPWVPWADIILNYKRYSRDKFYNEVLGISYDSGLRPLTTGQMKDVCNPDVYMCDADDYRKLAQSQPIFMGIDWGCHDDQTRILTEDRGFQYFRDLTPLDAVAQWDAVTREMSFVPPLGVTDKAWEGELLQVNTRGGIDLCVTDDHRMRVGRSQGKSWVTENAVELSKRGGCVKLPGTVRWGGAEVDEFTLPGVPRSAGYPGSSPRTFGMDGWLELLGYLLTEGGVCLKTNSKGVRVPYCLKMSQRLSVNPENVVKMRRCMDRLRIPYSEFPNTKTSDVNWTICGKQWWLWMSSAIGMHGHTKRIPRLFLGLSIRQLRILWDALMLGDGSLDKRPNCTGGSYTSTSKGLCEDVQEIAMKLGMRCHVEMHAPAEGNRKVRWRAQFSRGRDYQLNEPHKRVKRVPYKGRVYCCTVPTGYIVTERNGKVSIQGNSGENTYTVVTLCTYVDMKFRLFYAHRFTGTGTSPPIQLEEICRLIDAYQVQLVGTDYGGGFDRNDHLVRKYGTQRIHKYQYAGRPRKKVFWNGELNRWIAHRTEVMSDIFNAIKKGLCEFPRWEEFKDPHGQDMLNIYSEFNKVIRMIVYKNSAASPDDTFHSFLYCWLASMLIIKRPDIITPRKEIEDGTDDYEYTDHY